eukprot:CAMPEP_0167762734 /NCGR_PEP_ID=MMETSP0110_2-20121227/12948_1 /TAXON_ID=629695 /ORGANISM="Gymnochlora sp., Strain CCMP2014" /LENGTH=239 /DNA_ID=CAMNT_0007649673 /DNA_START=316 /DNA_END=1035 /DNA_ORIENTATION=+
MTAAVKQIKLEARDMKAEKDQLLKDKSEAEAYLRDARKINKNINKMLVRAQQVVSMAYLEKQRFEQQAMDLQNTLSLTREHEQEDAKSKMAYIDERVKEVNRKLAQLRSKEEDLKEAERAFQVKVAAFDISMENRKQQLMENSSESKQIEKGAVDKWEQIPSSFFCPITYEVMKDPVMTSDGYSYERKAIESWIKKSRMSPQTGLPLAHRKVVANMSLRNSIQEFLKDRPSVLKQIQQE